MKIKYLALNEKGRDFVVGDIHGCFPVVYEALSAVDFDFQNDRLICVGDLIDRGSHSDQVLEFLEHPFVHAVRGNHEESLIDIHTMYQGNEELMVSDLASMDATWFLSLPKDIQKEVVQALSQLPYLIEVETIQGLVGIVHADVPAGYKWADVKNLVANFRGQDKILWGRTRIRHFITSSVPDVYRIYIGHSVCPNVTARGNVYCIDTGAAYNDSPYYPDGYLTITRIDLSHDELIAPRKSTGLFEVRF